MNVLRVAHQSFEDKFSNLSFPANLSLNCCLELRIRVVVSFGYFNVAQCV